MAERDIRDRQPKKKRLAWPDMAKGVGIILVILSHLETTNPGVLRWISVFHMPLFFVISGVTLALEEKPGQSLRELAIKRGRGLLIPYFWFSVLVFAVDIGNLLLHKITTEQFADYALLSVTFCGKSVLWFLTALFLSLMLFLGLMELCGRKMMKLVLAVAALAVVSILLAMGWRSVNDVHGLEWGWKPLLHVTRTLIRAGVVLPFVAAGYLGCRFFRGEVYQGTYFGRKIVWLWPLLASGAAFLMSLYVAQLNWSDTNNIRLGNPLLYYLGGISGSAFVLFFCIAIPGSRLLAYIGRDSLVIMALHLDLYVMWAGMKLAGMFQNIYKEEWVFTALTVAFTLLLGCLGALLMRRFTPFVFNGAGGKGLAKKQGV